MPSITGWKATARPSVWLICRESSTFAFATRTSSLSPGETLQRLSKFAGVSAEGLQRGGPPEIVAGHSISGNPDRLLSGARRQIRAVVGGDGLE